MSGRRRRSYETGHRPKFLAVVDDTPECDRAVHFAARRAARTGASLVLLGVTEPPDGFEWIGVAEAMLAETEAETRAQVAAAAAAARAAAGIEAEQVHRVGERAEEIARLIEEDEDVSFLVLGACAGKEGPGPLVAGVMGRSSGGSAGSFAVPVVVVPGDLSDAEIAALAG